MRRDAGQHRHEAILQLPLPEQVVEERSEQRVDRRLSGGAGDRPGVRAAVGRDLLQLVVAEGLPDRGDTISTEPTRTAPM